MSCRRPPGGRDTIASVTQSQAGTGHAHKHAAQPAPPATAALIRALDNAKAVYDMVAARLGSGLNFTCDAGGGHCATSSEYWEGPPPSPLHFCPGWRNYSAENDRILNLRTSLYGYLGGLPAAQAAQRLNYASLAQELNNRFWP